MNSNRKRNAATAFGDEGKQSCNVETSSIRLFFSYFRKYRLLIYYYDVYVYTKHCWIYQFQFISVYVLVQFIEDSIRAIIKKSSIRKRDDGLNEAPYGKDFYICTVLFESGK